MAGKRKGRDSQDHDEDENEQQANKPPHLFFLGAGAPEEAADQQKSTHGKHHIRQPIEIEVLGGCLAEEIE